MNLWLIILLVFESFTFSFNVKLNNRITRRHHDMNNKNNNDEVPRLHADLDGLIKWSEKSGAKVDVKVKRGREGWSLYANGDTIKDNDLLSIPKKLCLFADPSKSKVPLLDNAINLINTLDKQQWRARLAIALLSERVRPSSPFRFYVRNLPFEFWGMPIFFSTAEFNIMQDISLMIRTRYRCRFLTDFSDNVLGPLHNKITDPFSGHVADVNAFGWGFATAASRALRNPDVIGDDGHVMVPLIDIASHSSDPNCIIVNSESSFLLRTIKNVKEGEELTINYGPLSNEELLEDYGFTVDNNSHDKILVKCDQFLLNTARMAMGQANTNDDYNIDLINYKDSIIRNIKVDSNIEEPNNKLTALALDSSSSLIKIGHGGNKIIDRWLHNWQIYWLKALNLYGSDADYAMTITGCSIEGIDGRLWAFLRILYSNNEEELLQHGYDPFILKQPGAIVSIKNEAQVLKTMTGLIAVMLRLYGSDLDSDIQELKSEIVVESSNIKEDETLSINSDDIVADVHKILRSIFKLKPPLPVSPTARKLMLEKENDVTTELPKSSKRVSVEDLILKEVSKQKEKQRVKEQKKIQLDSYSIQNYDDDNGSGDEELTNLENVVFKINEDDDELDIDSYANDNDNDSSNDILIDNDINHNLDDININNMGLSLPINVREGLRYRIRKKITMYKLAYELKEKYDNLKNLGLSINDDLLIAIPTFDMEQDSLNNNNNKKIRDLLDEVNINGNSKDVDDVLAEAKKLASQWGTRGLNL